MLQYRVRNKLTGKFLGNRKWGESYSTNGKFYKTIGYATAAIKGSGENKKDLEIVEYELKEIRTIEVK